MLNRDFARTSRDIGRVNMVIDQPHIKEQEDWGKVMSKFLTDYKNQQNEEALTSALQSSDEEAINKAAAAYDPKGFYDAMQKIKASREASDLEHERQKELADYNHALDMKKQDALYNLKNTLEAIKGGYGTAAQQNIAHLQGLGYSPEESAMMVFGGQNPTLNLSNLGKKGFEAYDKKVGEDLAARQKEAREAGEEYEQVTSDINRIKELLPEAKTQEFIDRKTPTMFFDDKTQEARGALRNMLGGLRLDQMKYMKGAISDKEQQFLSDVVSGDLTKYTPPEIVGTLSSIEYKAKRIKDKFAQQTAIPQESNDPLGLR